MAVEDTSIQSSLPDYPEMIMTAIEGLNEKEGSSKAAISKYIETNYSDLPAAHSTLLSHNLEKMTQMGQLVFLNNNYLKTDDPDAPPPQKRGRGRPPKPKGPSPPVTVAGPPRPRGRPPKPRDPLAPPKEKASSGSGRPRGRPRKFPKEGVAEVVAPPPGGVKRGRGRPRKAD